MYCPTCGAEASERLKFCKRCGAALNAPTETTAPGKFPSWLVVFFLLLIGFISVMGLIIPLAASQDLVQHFNAGDAMRIIALVVVAALALDGLLVWLLLKLIRLYQQPGTPAPSQLAAPPAIQVAPPPQLAAPPASVGSVTEHTTRNFEEYEDLIRARGPNRDTQ